MVQHPEVLWAQRSSESDPEKAGLFLILLAHYSDLNLFRILFILQSTYLISKHPPWNTHQPQLHFNSKQRLERKFYFTLSSATLMRSLSDEKEYAFDLELYSEVVPEVR